MTAYVIPPVTASQVARGATRFAITDAQLLYSSVPEAPPPAYSAGATYTDGAECSTGMVGGVITVWRSLQDGNLGNAPEEGAWWTRVGETYAEWSAPTVYAAGDMVLRVPTHSVYKRVTPGSTSQLPEDDATGVNWVRVATSNRWAMFDLLSATPTRAVSPLTVRLAPGRVSALMLLGVSDGTAKFGMTSGAANVWDPPAQPLDTTPIGSWEDYFFSAFAVRGNILRLDVPTYADGVIDLLLSAGVDTEIGKLIVGEAVPLGDTRKGPRVRRRSFTEVDRDKYGELQGILQRKSIPLVTQATYCRKELAVRARAALDFAASVPCVFIGLDDDQDEYADLLSLLAICLDSDLDLAERDECEINMELEGV